MKTSKKYYSIAWALVIIGTVIAIGYLISLWANGWRFWGSIDIEKTGAFGDYIGGFVGTIFSLAGFIFLYLTLKEQRIAFQKERFENHFFELIKLHRENINELTYTTYHRGEMMTSERRKVFKDIFREFEECLLEVRHFLNSKDPSDYYLSKHQKDIKLIYEKKNLSVDLIDLATTDIAYCIIFFGVGKEGEMILRNLFQKKYKPEYILHLLHYIRLKPKKEFKKGFNRWNELRKQEYQSFKSLTNKIYYYGKPGHKDVELSQTEQHIHKHLQLDKFYGGHQHRLGHYFRHLFQGYKFLNSQLNLTETERYFYGKTLRAQLSTYEQALLFINSISSIGMKWELTPEVKDAGNKTTEELQKEIENSSLITNYNLIKNLPGRHIYGLYYKNFYPNVKYESDGF
jgi:uncharacterized membrane protein